MRYSRDLRKRVIDFIADCGSKAEASRRFGVSRRCIYNWLEAEDPFAYEKPGPVNLIGLTRKHSLNMSKRSQTALRRNALPILAYRSGMSVMV